MAENIDVLSAKLEVKDSFTSKLNSFVKTTTKAEQTFEKFIDSVDKSARILEKTFDVLDAKINSLNTKIAASSDVTANKIVASANKIKESQDKVINNLTTKYSKMGKDVSDVFKTINKDAETLAKSGIKIGIGGKSSSKSSDEESNSKNSILGGVFAGNKTESMLSGVLSGNFTRVLGSLSLIGAGIMGAKKVLDTIDNWTQQGYNVLNSLSTGLLSISGLSKDVQEAGSLETSRVALDKLYGSKDLGQKYYKIGIGAAQDSVFGETNVIALQKKLAGVKLDYKPEDLQTILGLAALKPELGVEHVGFSLVDAMYGRTTSLKTNYMIDNKEVQKYLKNLQKTDPTDAQKWKNAFNSKGSVDNKQAYFDLLVNYIKKQTNYGSLAEEYSKTFEGQVSRIQGYWEILRADLLGIDRETGEVKPDSLFANVKSGLDDLRDWLKQSDTKSMLDSIGKGLADASKPVLHAFENLLNNINWVELGNVIDSIGKSIGKVVDSLSANPAFKDLIDKLPDIIERILGSKAVDATTKAKQAEDVAGGHPEKALAEGGIGWWEKTLMEWGFLNNSETESLLTNSGGNQQPKNNGIWGNLKNAAQIWGMGINNMFAYNTPTAEDKAFLTQANADTYLSQNPNLTDDQRNQIKGMLDEDAKNGQTIYHITVGEVKTDNDPMDLINKITNLQNNQK